MKIWLLREDLGVVQNLEGTWIKKLLNAKKCWNIGVDILAEIDVIESHSEI